MLEHAMPQPNERGGVFQVSWSLATPGIALKKSVPVAGDVFWLTYLKLKQEEQEVFILLEDLEETNLFKRKK